MALWGAGNGGQGFFANLNQLQHDYYNDQGAGTRVAYEAYLRALGLSSQQRDFGQQAYNDLYSQYSADTFASADPTHSYWTDWLQKSGNNALASMYNALPPRSRGAYRFGSWSPGRVTW